MKIEGIINQFFDMIYELIYELDINLIEDAEFCNKISKLEIGDEILFGKYIQRENQETEPIEWIVVNKTDDKVVLLCKKALELKQFKGKSWYDSALRLLVQMDTVLLKQMLKKVGHHMILYIKM